MRRYFGFLILFSLISNVGFAETFNEFPRYKIKSLVESYSWGKYHFNKSGPSAFMEAWVSDSESSESKRNFMRSLSKIDSLPVLSYVPGLSALVLESKHFLLVIQAKDINKREYYLNGDLVKFTDNIELNMIEINQILSRSLKIKKSKLSFLSFLIPEAVADQNDAKAFQERMKTWLTDYKSNLSSRTKPEGVSDEAFKAEQDNLGRVASELESKVADSKLAETLRNSKYFNEDLLNNANGNSEKDQALSDMHSTAFGQDPSKPREVDYTKRFEGELGKSRGGTASGGASSIKFASGGEWAKAIEEALKDTNYRKSFFETVPQGVEKVCSGFSSLDEAEKVQFWIAFMDALSYAESGHNTNDSYKESNGTISAGLFALSNTDNKHGGRCASINASNLTNGSLNASCAMEIMNKQLAKKGKLFFEGKEYYYWSVLSPGLHGHGAKGNSRLLDRFNYLKSTGKVPKKCG